MDDSLVALLFGAVIVVVFAWDQFNRPTYEQSRELTRLIELLAPADMRQRTIYWRAYVFYAGILLLVYITLCAYGTVLLEPLGLLPEGVSLDGQMIGTTEAPSIEPSANNVLTTGFTPDQLAGPQMLSAEVDQNTQSDAESFGIGIEPIVPLTVSLAMVGLAPSVPILQRFEEKIRFAAHRLSGIPTRLVTGSRQMRHRPLDLAQGADTLLIPSQDWERMRHYDRSAAGKLDDPGAFHEDLTKILAFRSWILQEKLQLANLATRDHLADVEGNVARKIERLIFDLDTLTGFDSPERAMPAAAPRDDDQLRAAWATFAKEADGICADVCVLLMLYVEHGILPTEGDAERLGWGNPADAEAADIARQRYLAQNKVMQFVSNAARYADRDSISLVLWTRGAAAALGVALIMGMILGEDTNTEAAQEKSRLLLGILYMLSAALTYALAMLVAVTYQQSAYQNGAWFNVFRENWARWLSQLVSVFLWSALAALICHLGYNIYATAGVVGWDVVRDNWLPVLRYALEYEGPAAMRGPVLAILVVVMADAWRAGNDAARAVRWLPLVSGAVMFVTGMLTRMLTSQVGAAARGAEMDWTATLPLMLRAGLLAGLIGLVVGFYIRATLRHSFPHALGANEDNDAATTRAETVPRAAE